MRSVLAWFTVRGASFLTAGIVGLLAALVLGSEAMIFRTVESIEGSANKPLPVPENVRLKAAAA